MYGIEIRRDSLRVDSVHVGDVEDNAAPPGPADPGRLKRQVEPVVVTDGESRETGVPSAGSNLETE